MTKEAIIHDLREIGKTNSVSSYKRMVCEMAADLIENQAKALDALTLANMALKEKAERHLGCHSDCEGHAAWQEEQRVLREKITAAKQEDQEVERYILKRIERREKRARKK